MQLASYDLLQGNTQCPPPSQEPTAERCRAIAGELGHPFKYLWTYNFTGCAQVTETNVVAGGASATTTHVAFSPLPWPGRDFMLGPSYTGSQRVGCSEWVDHFGTSPGASSKSGSGSIGSAFAFP